MGWTNIETGEVRSPFPWLREAEIDIDENLCVTSKSSILNSQFSTLYAFAFSGIHSFSPRLFPLMERFPERFPIMDFYLSICHRSAIYGCIKEDLRLMDVGKIDTLSEAEQVIQTL